MVPLICPVLWLSPEGLASFGQSPRKQITVCFELRCEDQKVIKWRVLESILEILGSGGKKYAG